MQGRVRVRVQALALVLRVRVAAGALLELRRARHCLPRVGAVRGLRLRLQVELALQVTARAALYSARPVQAVAQVQVRARLRSLRLQRTSSCQCGR